MSDGHMTTRMTPLSIGNSQAASSPGEAKDAAKRDADEWVDARKRTARPGRDESRWPGRSGVGLGLQDLAATIEAGRADVVAQVHFARGGFDRRARGRQRIVRTVHAALRGRLLVLLDSHFDTPGNA